VLGAETALAAMEIGKRRAQIVGAEVRPSRREAELGVGPSQSRKSDSRFSPLVRTRRSTSW